MTAFEELKEICRVACHERNACEPGFKALMQTETIGQILAVWRENWEDVYKSKFSDVMAANIVRVFERSKEEFHQSQVYVNESAERGLVIISSPTEKVIVDGTAKAYIFAGAAECEATDNAQVYGRSEDAVVTLRGHAYGHFEAGRVTVREFAEAHGRFTVCHTYDAAEVVCEGGVVVDHGHRRIAAYLGAVVYSDATRNIELSGQARQYPLADYTDETEKEETA